MKRSLLLIVAAALLAACQTHRLTVEPKGGGALAINTDLVTAVKYEGGLEARVEREDSTGWVVVVQDGKTLEWNLEGDGRKAWLKKGGLLKWSLEFVEIEWAAAMALLGLPETWPDDPDPGDGEVVEE